LHFFLRQLVLSPCWSFACACSLAVYLPLFISHLPPILFLSTLHSTVRSILTLACPSLGTLARKRVCLAFRSTASRCLAHITFCASVEFPAASSVSIAFSLWLLSSCCTVEFFARVRHVAMLRVGPEASSHYVHRMLSAYKIAASLSFHSSRCVGSMCCARGRREGVRPVAVTLVLGDEVRLSPAVSMIIARVAKVRPALLGCRGSALRVLAAAATDESETLNQCCPGPLLHCSCEISSWSLHPPRLHHFHCHCVLGPDEATQLHW
jgi:hypothetical protein